MVPLTVEIYEGRSKSFAIRYDAQMTQTKIFVIFQHSDGCIRLFF